MYRISGRGATVREPDVGQAGAQKQCCVECKDVAMMLRSESGSRNQAGHERRFSRSVRSSVVIARLSRCRYAPSFSIGCPAAGSGGRRGARLEAVGSASSAVVPASRGLLHGVGRQYDVCTADRWRPPVLPRWDEKRGAVEIDSILTQVGTPDRARARGRQGLRSAATGLDQSGIDPEAKVGAVRK